MAIAPLKGIRVLDFGQVWAGPLLGVYLGDFGAEVIQVVSVARSAVQATAGVAGEPGPIAYSSLGERSQTSVSVRPVPVFSWVALGISTNFQLFPLSSLSITAR